MSRWYSMLMILPVWFAIIVYLSVMMFFRLENQALEDWRLKQVVNNCTDSAIEELLEASDLGMDYNDWGDFNTDPDLALSDFVDTFLLNYNMPLNNTTREEVKINFIQAFCVAGYDGYYVYDHRVTEKGGGYSLVGSPKIPYLYKDERVPGRYVTYAINMGFDKCYKLTDATITKADMPVSQKEALKIINTRISDDLMERVDRAYKNGWQESVNIPTALTTIHSTNPIQSPTVLAFVDNVNITTVKPVNAFGIGGSRAKVARPVAAYKRLNNDTGEWVKYYSYTDLLPPGINDDKSLIEEVYMSPEDAASAGYYHDPLYMN